MNDFDDTFGGPPEPGFHDPYAYGDADGYILVALLCLALLVTAVCLAGYFLGRAQTRRRMMAERKASREYIYRHLRYTLDKALKTSGAVILERGREVSDILEARLGLLLALDGKLAKHVATLRNALDPQPAKPDTSSEKKGPRDTYNHAYTVRTALESLSDFWTEDKILPLLAAAQDELIKPPPPEPKAQQSAFGLSRHRPASAAKTVKGALDDANKAGTTPVDPLPVKTEEAPPAPTPEPTPTPPAPKPPRRGKLPAHKRNMLA